jgi:hypothetical protein
MSHTRKLPRLPVLVLSVFAVGALAILPGVAPASAASFAQNDPPPTVTSQPSTTTDLQGVGGGTVITCTAKANNPHDSSHVGGTVNFVGSVSCTAPVASLNLTLSLYLGSYVQATNNKSNTGNATISNNVSALCSSGGWQGTTYAVVTFPPGYVPASGVISDDKIVTINC